MPRGLGIHGPLPGGRTNLAMAGEDLLFIPGRNAEHSSTAQDDPPGRMPQGYRLIQVTGCCPEGRRRASPGSAPFGKRPKRALNETGLMIRCFVDTTQAPFLRSRGKVWHYSAPPSLQRGGVLKKENRAVCWIPFLFCNCPCHLPRDLRRGVSLAHFSALEPLGGGCSFLPHAGPRDVSSPGSLHAHLFCFRPPGSLAEGVDML